MMFDHSYSLNSIIAWAAWTLAVVTAVLYAVFTQRFSAAVTLLAAAGATLHVRGFIRGLERRERAAFELGRDSVHVVR